MKKAFTIYETIIVIVVIGIISAIAIPRLNTDKLQEAADQILSHIRYTQHLAMMDDRFDPKDQNWYQERWRIAFRDCNGGSNNKYYVIYRDLNHGGASAAPGKNESAKNPSDGKYLYNDGSCVEQNDESGEVLIGNKYEITNLTPTGGCSNQYIAFDEIGRPYNDTYSSIYVPMTQDCNLTFYSSYGQFTITITKETGYAYISSIHD
ncbi:prepilin-type N-terminal cleavage/methylation domain-containing protein [Nitrosophilus kaiyonis]|uniref:prepilin-type N-terminal cleavage/methylation domain-containing protein n=1 Tax=Nitrosophilus kaiyonis TaxID=2930200 RepID=UPI00248FB11F|nr:prepilin-type N-terminal cleavage/methylation domain-containing protein [Nitrosophilus kaiyonis]